MTSFLLVPVIVYRRVSVGLGSAPVRSDGLGDLVRGGKRGAHQCARDEGSIASLSCLPTSAVGAECHPDERQRLSCRLSPAPGWHGASGPVSHGLRDHHVDRAAFGSPVGGVHPGQKNILADQLSRPTRFFPRNGPVF